MDVCIPDRSVSRLHAVFTPMGDGRYQLEDKDSRNGTFVAADPALAPWTGEQRAERVNAMAASALAPLVVGDAVDSTQLVHAWLAQLRALGR